jgi:predicted 2-oxoglutarate/Fe(II)-dependent dioxygenase YbiX
MNHKLLKNNYLIIPNFINFHRAKELANDFKVYSENKNSDGDPQAPNSRSEYNYISFLELLCEKTHQVSSILEETVLPTYAYSRVYYGGSVLERHRDRDACEISLTLHLDGDKSWPIFIQTPEGEERSVILEPGDAMMYLGKIADHWRDAYEGDYYTQVFLHYVRSRGDCAYVYFDKDRDKNNTSEENNDEVKTDKTTDNLTMNQDSNIEERNPKKSIELIVPNPANTLEQYIHVFEDIFPHDLCNEILNEYENSNEWQHSLVGNGSAEKGIRNCNSIFISSSDTISKNQEKREEIDNKIHKYIAKAVEQYHELHKEFLIDIDTGYDLLRYQEGEFYIEHTDSFKEQQRSVSCSIQLNDDYEGGNFAFFNRQMQIRSGKGSTIMFPSNFMFPHEIMPVTKGTRYSIITWLV